MVRKEKFDEVGLSALQYQTPLWGDSRTFYDPDVLHAAVQSWITKDFNNDGFTDIFLSFFTDDSQNISAPFMLYFYDPITGTYINKSDRIKNNIGQPFNRKAMAADLNGDRILDIVAVSHPECDQCLYSYFDIILSSSDTTWIQNRLKKSDRSRDEGYYHGVAIGDIDNDGDIDIVLGEANKDGMYSLINDGKANFNQIQAVNIEKETDFITKAYTLELADINKDGCLDLLYWHDKLNTKILFGNCSQTFGNFFQDLTPYTQKFPLVMDYDVRDLDEDGDHDLILTATDYTSGWQLIFLENSGKDSIGKIDWIDHTLEITNDLISDNFYKDEFSVNWVPYIQVIDINKDGKLDIIPHKAFTGIERMSQWMLISESPWKYKYKSLPFSEPVTNFNYTIKENGKVTITWKKERFLYSQSDGGISNWAIYISNKPWGDRSQLINPAIIVSANEARVDETNNQCIIDRTREEMYIRIAPIDSFGIESPLSSMLKVGKNELTAFAGEDQTVFEGYTITLYGSASNNPSGSIAYYRWIAPPEIRLSSTSSSSPKFIAPEVTKDTFFIISLIINDGIIDSAPDSVKISVRNLNKIPIANAGTNQTVNEGTNVVLDGSGSYDPEGNMLTYKWIGPQGIVLNNSDSINPTFKAPNVNLDKDLIFTLYVSDGQYSSIASRVTITIKQINNSPVANAGKNQTINEGETCYLDGSLSFDIDGDLLTFDWFTKSGIKLNWASTVNPSFIAPEVIRDTIFEFFLIVNDGFITSATSKVDISVINVIKTNVHDIFSKNFSISSNSQSGVLKIEGLPINEKNTICVYSVDGRLITKTTAASTSETIDLSSQVSGVYLLFINNHPFKIIKN